MRGRCPVPSIRYSLSGPGDDPRAHDRRAPLGQRQDDGDARTLRAFKRRGADVVGLKSGPDYIDPAFPAAASGREGVDLDTRAMPPKLLAAIAAQASGICDLALCEASMGLFDGVLDERRRGGAGRRRGGAWASGPHGHRRVGAGAVSRGGGQRLRDL